MITGGARAVSVIAYFTTEFKKIVSSYLRITYVGVPLRIAMMLAKGDAKA